jgi:hypothetical protein
MRRTRFSFRFNFFDSSHVTSSTRRRAFQSWLAGLPPEFTIRQHRGVIVATPVQGLTPCSTPDRVAYAEHLSRPRLAPSVMHFTSQSGRTCLIVPVKPYSHIGCFAREASSREFRDLVTVVHTIVAPHTGATITTHGFDIGWMHIRLTPPSVCCRKLQKVRS